MHRILVEVGLGANFYIRLAWVNAFKAAGFDVHYWDRAGKSPHDIFDEINPTVFIGSTWQLDRPLVKNLISRPELKILLYCSHYGSEDSQIDTSQYPILFATEDEKRLTEQVAKACPGFRYVITQYNNNRIAGTHDLWQRCGVSPYGVMLCADVTQYGPTEPDNSYRSDVVFAGGYWPYKSYWLDKLIVPLTYPGTSWKIKLFGSGWSNVHDLGRISSQELSKFYTNTIVCPNVFEKHSVDFLPDINQRTYEIPACGGFQLCQKVIGLEDIFTDDEVVTFSSKEEFFDKVVYYLNRPEETIPYRQRGLQTIMVAHTNFHRAVEIGRLLELDCSNLVKLANEVYERYCGENN